MRTFDYLNLPRELFEREVGDLNARIHQDKGKLDVMKRVFPSELSELMGQAHADNVASSLSIEGLSLPAGKLEGILRRERDTYPERDESWLGEASEVEAQAFGYARALHAIEQQPETLELASGTVVRIFETLYANHFFGKKSRYRRKDYTYVPVDGHMQAVPVSPVPAFETPLVFGGACDSLAEAFDADRCSSLILAAVFTVDFLCIHPFEVGNGRVARLFAMLLMEKAGFDIFRYVSVDALVAQDAGGYYDALNSCVEGWEAGRADYRPFAKFWFSCIHRAYQQLFDHMDVRSQLPAGKGERVRAYIERARGAVSKRQIMDANPDISIGTVEAALGKLVKDGAVRKVGQGRSTAYEWVR